MRLESGPEEPLEPAQLISPSHPIFGSTWFLALGLEFLSFVTIGDLGQIILFFFSGMFCAL